MKVVILGKNGLRQADINRRKAIREKCLNCAGWSHKEITNCTFTGCPDWRSVLKSLYENNL